MSQTNTRVGDVRVAAGEDLTGKEGFLVKLTHDSSVPRGGFEEIPLPSRVVNGLDPETCENIDGFKNTFICVFSMKIRSGFTTTSFDEKDTDTLLFLPIGEKRAADRFDVTIPPPRCVDDGMKAWWPLDETSGIRASDIFGGNHGTHMGVNGLPTPINGMVAGALNFDGVDDYVNIPDSAALDLGSAGTIAMWIDPKNFAADDENSVPRVIAKGFDGSPDDDNPLNEKSPYQIVLIDTNMGSTMDGTFSLILGDGSDAQFIHGTKVIFSDSFTHIAATWNGSFVKLYVDGVLDVSNTQVVTPFANGEPLQIGREKDPVHSDGVGFYKGIIDEVKIFGRALSASEIADIIDQDGACKRPDCN